MINKLKNLKKSEKIKENSLVFKKSKSCEKNIFCVHKENIIILVLAIEEIISLHPELSSSAPHFRIQGGYPERDGEGGGSRKSRV